MIDMTPIDASNITYEVVSGLPTPYSYLMTATILNPITAGPVRGHSIEIMVHNIIGYETNWIGSVAVMSGGIQVVGPVYNYPNPFKPLSADPSENSTTIAYTLSVNAPVTIIIYDITGHEVHRGIYNSGTEGGRAGLNQVTWSGKDLFSQPVPNGMFVYKIVSGASVLATGKLVVLD
jgi:hypothetical protein